MSEGSAREVSLDFGFYASDKSGEGAFHLEPLCLYGLDPCYASKDINDIFSVIVDVHPKIHIE